MSPRAVATTIHAPGSTSVSPSELRLSDSLLLEAVAQWPDIVVCYDLALRRTYGNSTYDRHTGQTGAQYLGKTLQEYSVTGDATADLIDCLLRTVREEAPQALDLQWPSVRGGLHWFEVRTALQRDAAAQLVGIVLVARDVTERVLAQRELVLQSQTDRLTGLGNRQGVYQVGHRLVQQARSEGCSLGLLVLDVDGFKAVNDTFGVMAGDRLLFAVAARLKEALASQVPVARVGGDEFVVLLPEVGDRMALDATLGRIMATLGAPLELSGRLLNPSASIGIALFPQDGEDLDQLLAHADLALHQAKLSGRASYAFYRPEFAHRTRERLDMLADLAAAQSGDGLVLYYQPQIELAAGRLIGAEALLRWQHPRHGLIGPDRFIALAEESGLIVPMGRWVMRQAAQAVARWNLGVSAPLRLAVNVSVQQFLGDDLVETVREALHSAGCQPEWLGIEVTESLLLEDSSRVMTALNTLTDMGLRIEIDDFGTGYSALGYLTHFEVHGLKIDRSFVHHLDSEPRHGELLKAFIAIAQALKLDLIAEGVETQAQADFLRAHGCLKGQGYLFGRPEPAAVFEAAWAASRQ